jgi:hypothetical protein
MLLPAKLERDTFHGEMKFCRNMSIVKQNLDSLNQIIDLAKI